MVFSRWRVHSSSIVPRATFLYRLRPFQRPLLVLYSSISVISKQSESNPNVTARTPIQLPRCTYNQIRQYRPLTNSLSHHPHSQHSTHKKSHIDRLQLWRERSIDGTSMLDQFEQKIITGQDMEDMISASKRTELAPFFLGAAVIRSIRQDQIEKAIEYQCQILHIEKSLLLDLDDPHSRKQIELVRKISICTGTALASYAFSLEKEIDFWKFLENLIYKNVAFIAPGKLVARSHTDTKSILSIYKRNGKDALFFRVLASIVHRTDASEPGWYRNISLHMRKSHMFTFLDCRLNMLESDRRSSVFSIATIFSVSPRERFMSLFEKSRKSTPSEFTADDWEFLVDLMKKCGGSPFWVKFLAASYFNDKLPPSLVPTHEEANYTKRETPTPFEDVCDRFFDKSSHLIRRSKEVTIEWNRLLRPLGGLPLNKYTDLLVKALEELEKDLQMNQATDTQVSSLMSLMQVFLEQGSDVAFDVVEKTCHTLSQHNLISYDVISMVKTALNHLTCVDLSSDTYLDVIRAAVFILDQMEDITDRICFLSQLLDQSDGKKLGTLPFETMLYKSVANAFPSKFAPGSEEHDLFVSLLMKAYESGIWSPRLETRYYDAVGWPTNPSDILDQFTHRSSHVEPLSVADLFDCLESLADDAQQNPLKCYREMLVLIKFHIHSQVVPEQQIPESIKTWMRTIITAVPSLDHCIQYLEYIRKYIFDDKIWIQETFMMIPAQTDKWNEASWNRTRILSAISQGLCPIDFIWKFYMSDHYSTSELPILKNAILQHYNTHDERKSLLKSVMEAQDVESLLKRIDLLFETGIWRATVSNNQDSTNSLSIVNVFEHIASVTLSRYDPSSQERLLNYLIDHDMIPSTACLHLVADHLNSLIVSEKRFKILIQRGLVDALFAFQFVDSHNWSDSSINIIQSQQTNIVQATDSERLAGATVLLLKGLETVSEASARSLEAIARKLHLVCDSDLFLSRLGDISQSGEHQKALRLLCRMVSWDFAIPLSVYNQVISSAVAHDSSSLMELWHAFLKILNRWELDGMTDAVASDILYVIVKEIDWGNMQESDAQGLEHQVFELILSIGTKTCRYSGISSVPTKILNVLYENLNYPFIWKLLKSLDKSFMPDQDILESVLTKRLFSPLEALEIIENADISISSPKLLKTINRLRQTRTDLMRKLEWKLIPLLRASKWESITNLISSYRVPHRVRLQSLHEALLHMIKKDSPSDNMKLWGLEAKTGFELPKVIQEKYLGLIYKMRLDLRQPLLSAILKRPDLSDTTLQIITEHAVQEHDRYMLHQISRLQIDSKSPVLSTLLDVFSALGDVAQVRSLLMRTEASQREGDDAHEWQLKYMLQATANQKNLQAFDLYWEKLRELQKYQPVSPEYSLLAMRVAAMDGVDGVLEAERMFKDIWEGENSYQQHRSGNMFSILMDAHTEGHRFDQVERIYQECCSQGFGSDYSVVLSRLRQFSKAGDETALSAFFQELFDRKDITSSQIVDAFEVVSMGKIPASLRSFIIRTFYKFVSRKDPQAPRLAWVILHGFFSTLPLYMEAIRFFQSISTSCPLFYKDPYQVASLLPLIAKKSGSPETVNRWKSRFLDILGEVNHPSDRKIVYDAVAKSFAYCHSSDGVNETLDEMFRQLSPLARPDSATYGGIISAYLYNVTNPVGYSLVVSLLDDLRTKSVVLSPSSLIDLMKGFSYQQRYDMVKKAWDIFYRCYMTSDMRWLAQFDQVVETDRAIAVYLDAVGRSGTIVELEQAWSSIKRNWRPNDNAICSFAEAHLFLNNPHRAIQIVLGTASRPSFYTTHKVKPSMKALATLLGGLMKQSDRRTYLPVMREIKRQADTLAATGLATGTNRSKHLYESMTNMLARVGV